MSNYKPFKSAERLYIFAFIHQASSNITNYNKLSRGETICHPPISADLRPRADGSAFNTALVACRAAALPIAQPYVAAGWTDRGIA